MLTSSFKIITLFHFLFNSEFKKKLPAQGPGSRSGTRAGSTSGDNLRTGTSLGRTGTSLGGPNRANTRMGKKVKEDKKGPPEDVVSIWLVLLSVLTIYIH